MSCLLLKGGTILIHDENDKVTSVKGDLLVKDHVISRIESTIPEFENCEVIDCTDKIISPGFVDTHHHMWESALKGVVEDLTAVPYFSTMFTAASCFTPKDIFWGNLAGGLEAINAGTTTVLDFAHANWTKDHGMQALSGTMTSGIRSVHAFAPSVTLKATSPEPELGDLIPDWFMPTLGELVKLTQGKSSRIRIAAGFDFYFMPQEFVTNFFNTARSLGVDIITSHWAKTRTWQGPGLPALLNSYGLLDHRFVVSHMGGVTKEDAELLKDAKAFIAASPSTEMTMGLGPPACFRTDLDVDSICSIGVDCHCATSASMVNEVRVGLLAARGIENSGKLGKGSFPIHASSSDAYNMITIGGARALNMEAQIGSIKIGKKADLLIFNTKSPAMSPVLDPVTAIVMHSGVDDIDTVIVDGEVKKKDGKLLQVQIVQWVENKLRALGDSISWLDVAKKLPELQERFVLNLSKHNLKQLDTFVENLYGM